MKNINTVFLDDEPDAIVFLKAQLSRSSHNLDFVAEFTDPEAALEWSGWNEVDLLFLDMEMPSMSGFQFLDALGTLNMEIIFITAYEQYALGAIKRGATDYILKPVDFEELSKALDVVTDNLNKQGNQTEREPLQKICIPAHGGFEIIELADLLWLESSNNYTYLHSQKSDKPILVSRTLRAFEKKLAQTSFIRVNQSTIINAAFVRSFDKRNGSSVTLNNQQEFTVSPTYKNNFLSYFDDMMM